ncbi:MAG: acetyltransferase, ribosomal protein N-acetylase [Chitinophagaceae bacterium]|jgi:RimJ/RimL family protein N-acetyltransferase|nr:acetyltransferase, ribosomal protein N-acetylase [Chitinophagaceae bacterium]
MNIILQTDRLLFRQFTLEDAHLIFELNSDPEVVKYVHEAPTTRENAPTVIRDIILPQYELGLGRWAVINSSGNEFIGWCGLKKLTNGDIDLGFRYKRDHWGKGYATEAALAVVKYAFEVQGLDRIIGRAHIDNTASQNVLEKCGMQFMGDTEEDGQLVRNYALVSTFKG